MTAIATRLLAVLLVYGAAPSVSAGRQTGLEPNPKETVSQAAPEEPAIDIARIRRLLGERRPPGSEESLPGLASMLRVEFILQTMPVDVNGIPRFRGTVYGFKWKLATFAEQFKAFDTESRRPYNLAPSLQELSARMPGLQYFHPVNAVMAANKAIRGALYRAKVEKARRQVEAELRAIKAQNAALAAADSKPPVQATAEQPASRETAALHVDAVKFEPIRQGRNVLRVTVRNTGQRGEIFAISINARSPDYATGIGWGTQFTESIAPAETKDLRFVYCVYGPITDKTAISLAFYNPPSADRIERAFLLERRQYSGAELPRAPGRNKEAAGRVAERQRAEVVAALRQTQHDLKSKRFGEAWRSFSRDLCAVDFCRTESDFLENIANEDSPMKPFLWPMDRFLAFDPAEAWLADDGRIVLLGGSTDPELRVYFVREDGRWKVDDFAGYVPKVVLWRDWEQRLLPKMETRRTEHFDLFYGKESTAAREAERIASEREAGYKAISDLFAIAGDTRIRLVFFEDAATKYGETGHQGAGWAYDNTVVEVYSPSQKLNPFHEVCHILTGGLGDPPALFNEGVAVYVSERLGAPALKELGGGTVRVNDRVREIRSQGLFMPLDRVIRFTEIGPEESKPSVSYAEAASFVEFLVEQFGKQKFLAAYKSLKNSDDATVQEKNLAALRAIYGMSLSDLEAWWLKSLNPGMRVESRARTVATLLHAAEQVFPLPEDLPLLGTCVDQFVGLERRLETELEATLHADQRETVGRISTRNQACGNLWTLEPGRPGTKVHLRLLCAL